MVAVKATCWLTAEGEGAARSVVVVVVRPTAWTSPFAGEALPVKFKSPLVYVATTLLEPDDAKV
jgi:hypothetical protein